LVAQASSDIPSIKVADFGLARIKEKYYVASENKIIPYKWTAPESIKFAKYSSKSDVWSFAVTLWEMFNYGLVPYYGRFCIELKSRF